MKIHFSRQAYNKLDAASRRQLTPVDCGCSIAEMPTCEDCGGDGLIFEGTLSAEDTAAIVENFRRQGFTLGKIGTH